MAQAIDFELRNDYIGRPENMSNHQCYGLPVCRFLTPIPGVIPRAQPEKVLAHVSCWELTEEEVQEIIKTKKVYLKTLGGSTFPISIWGTLPVYPGEELLSDKVLTEEEIKKIKGLE